MTFNKSKGLVQMYEVKIHAICYASEKANDFTLYSRDLTPSGELMTRFPLPKVSKYKLYFVQSSAIQLARNGVFATRSEASYGTNWTIVLS